MPKPKTNRKYRYKEFFAPEKLRTILDKIWVFETAAITGSDRFFHLTTDYTATLVFIFPRNVKRISIYLSGPNSQNIPFENSPELIAIGCRFKPLAAHQLFGIGPRLTINKAVKLSEFLPALVFRKLRSAILSEKLLRGKIRVIYELFSGLLNSVTIPGEDMINEIISKIIISNGKTKLEDIYSGLSLSNRQLQRKFNRRTGLSPKEFCRIVRFHSVTRKLMKNKFPHFDVLVESGYYDQSHYYREFKEFTGMLPAVYVTRQRNIKLRTLI